MSNCNARRGEWRLPSYLYKNACKRHWPTLLQQIDAGSRIFWNVQVPRPERADSLANQPTNLQLPTRLFLRLLGFAQKPLPLQSLQGCWICCTMPGPMGRIMTCTPVPWQVSHWWRCPLLLPVPLHLPQGSLRERDSFLNTAK